MKTKIQKSIHFLEYLHSLYRDLSTNSEANPAEIIKVDGKNLVIVSSFSDTFTGSRTAEAYVAMPINSYEEINPVAPLEYEDHWAAVRRCHRARSYNGMKLWVSVADTSEEIVLRGNVIIINSYAPKEVQGIIPWNVF